MQEICLSAAPILRCQDLTELESVLLLIPPGVQAIFCAGLIMLRGCDRKHVLLTTEGFTYLALALLDFFAHVIPKISDSLDAFKPLDIVIGTLSFLPLLMYTVFLYIFTASEFIPILPQRLQSTMRYMLLALIPAVVITNEIGSFVSISYRIIDGELSVGFTNQTVHIAFDDLDLALLTVFQLLSFTIVAFRLVRALAYRRDIEANPDSVEVRAHLFRGLVWIVAGVLLGAVETIAGLAMEGFPLAFARRILVLLGRACLIVGVFSGVDTVEDFRILKFEAIQQRRRSKLLGMISNPRNSTFRQIDGHLWDSEAATAARAIRRVSAFASGETVDVRSISIRFPTVEDTAPTQSSVRATEDAGSSAFTAPSSGLSSLPSAPSRAYTPPSTVPTSSTTRAVMIHTRPSTRLSTRPPTPPLQAMRSARSISRHPDRVTVHWGNGVPYLELRRLSDLDVHSILTPFSHGLADKHSHMHTQSQPLTNAQVRALHARSMPPQTLAALHAVAFPRRSTPNLASATPLPPLIVPPLPRPISASPSDVSVPSVYSSTKEDDDDSSLVAPLPLGNGSRSSTPVSAAIITPVVRVDRAYARRTYAGRPAPHQALERRPSTPESTLAMLHALTVQFPSTPPTPSWLVQMQQQQQQHRTQREDDAPSRSDTISAVGSLPGNRVNARSAGARVHMRDDSDATAVSHSQAISHIQTSDGAPQRSSHDSHDETLIGCTDVKPINTDTGEVDVEVEENSAAAAFPTPVSMLMPLPPAAKDKGKVREADERARKARTVDARARKSLSILEADNADSDVGDTASAQSRARARIARIKSVGNAPMRWTPTPTSSMHTRDSIAVVLDEVPSDADQKSRRSSRKLQKRRSSYAKRKSGVSAIDRSDHSTLDD